MWPARIKSSYIFML